MASLNLSTNSASISSSYSGVINSNSTGSSPTFARWAIFSVTAPLVNAFKQDSGGKESVLKVQDTGEGELSELIDDLSDGRVQFAFVKVKDPNTTLPKYVLLAWCGEGVPERTKGYFTSHLAAVSKVLHGYHVQITARSDRDVTPESIIQKVADASGAKYSAASAPATASTGPAPPVATKPVFQPTRGGASSGFNPLASRTRMPQPAGNVDDDGWGADAPPVTRSQIEKVAPAYKPTKVNMAELTKQSQEPSRFSSSNNPENTNNGDIVRGGYQPIGKVDIAAIRAQAKEKSDDRPTTVRGAYEPVGKVDIAAIRAKAQKPADEVIPSPAQTSNDIEAPKSLAERSAAFNQSERITTLPKPKVANRFGSASSSFAGTKAPTPGQFGLQSAPANAAPAPVGAASRTFADEGGKTPAQIWAEKKARQRGLSGAADTAPPVSSAPIASQASGNGEWKSGYTGKSWAPVGTNATGRSATASIDEQRTGEPERDEQEAPASPIGGIGSIRDRFQGSAPMGAPVSASSVSRDNTEDAIPPPVPSNSRPVGGVAMPGLPNRREDDEESAAPNIPPPPAVPRTPTPEPEEEEEREESPVRVAMPIARGKVTELEAPEERDPVPPMPIQPMQEAVPDEEDLTEEPTGHDPARAAGAAVASATFGGEQTRSSGGLRAVAVYDYEKAEDNEIEFQEGEHITEIDQVDPDWWSGKNARGEVGLFPSNYVELVEQEAETESAPAPAPAIPAASAAPAVSKPSGPTATALYDYEAAEDNELSFAEGDKITDLEYPDEDWWHGSCGGKSGLFPSNYVELHQ